MKITSRQARDVHNMAMVKTGSELFTSAEVARLPTRSSRCWRIEEVYTRDVRVPIVSDDDAFCYGWKNVPQKPTSDDGWEIFDTSKDHKTGWTRAVFLGPLGELRRREQWS